MNSDTGAKGGTIGGTLVCFLVSLNTQEMAKTAILTAIGATVSFLVSIALRTLWRWLVRKLP